MAADSERHIQTRINHRIREQLVSSTKHSTGLITAVDYSLYRHQKKQSLREVRMTERLERQQYMEIERRYKQNHLGDCRPSVNMVLRCTF